MPMMRKTPLAWKNLTHDPRRFALALSGIGFAVFLMCMQLGFQQALFDSTVALIRGLNADLVIASKAHYTVIVKETFTHRRLAQARACPGVQSAWPLYLETKRSVWKNRETHEEHLIRVVAFDPRDPVLNL